MLIRNSLVRRENPKELAVIDKAKELTYEQLAGRAMAIRQRLNGINGESIAIFLPNSASYIAAFYGVIMAGKVALPISVKLTTREVGVLLGSVQAVITAKEYAEHFKNSPVDVIFSEDLPLDAPIYSAEDVCGDSVMVMLSTSGTSGGGKIVQLTENNVATSTLAYLDKMDFEKFNRNELRMTLGTPFSSVYGLMVITACIIKSIPIVVMEDNFTLDTLYRAAEEYKITHFEGGVTVGLLMEQMAGRSIPYDISSLKYFGLAGSKLSGLTLRRLMDAYPHAEFWTGYGMTEAGPLIAKPYKKVNPSKLDSVGTIIDSITVMVEANGELTDAAYISGELVVKGPGIMLGYYKNETETRKVIKNGYLHTGDIGYFDEDGYLYICGRKKSIIIVRGFNVYPEEVESCILNSGLAADCFVYGKEDSRGGELVCADVILAEGDAEGIRRYCAEHLADYKRPLEINLVGEIRKTVTGKTGR